MKENVLDLVTQKMVLRKTEIEIELQSLLLSSFDNPLLVSETILGLVRDYKEIITDLQFWESFKSDKLFINNNNENEK